MKLGIKPTPAKVFSAKLGFRKPKYPTENGEVGKLQPFGARRN
jgi:hypothetical protein